MCFLSVSCFGGSMFCAKDFLDFCVFESTYFLRLCFLVISTYDFVHVKIIPVTFFLLFFDFLLVTFLYLCLWLWFFYLWFFSCDFLNSCHNTNIRSNITESQVPTFQGKTNLSYVLVCLFFGGGSTKWWMCWSGWKKLPWRVGCDTVDEKILHHSGCAKGLLYRS